MSGEEEDMSLLGLSVGTGATWELPYADITEDGKDTGMQKLKAKYPDLAPAYGKRSIRQVAPESGKRGKYRCKVCEGKKVNCSCQMSVPRKWFESLPEVILQKFREEFPEFVEDAMEAKAVAATVAKIPGNDLTTAESKPSDGRPGETGPDSK